jgi:zinc protease
VTRPPRRLALVVGVLALASAASAQVPDWPTERPPRPLQAREVKFPPYAVRTLKNGLQVIAVSHHEQPAISLRLIVRAGGAQDPSARPGVAYLAASLLDQGTATRSAEQIANTIDSIGGAIASGAGTDLTFINAAVMKDNFGLGLDLVSDLARNPAFAAEEVERQRQQILSGLKVSYDDPDYLAGVVFDRLVYGFHSYGQPDSGTPTSIAAITRSDLLAFHTKWFGANNAILAIVGDISHDEAFAGAERAFGGWGRVELTTAKVQEAPQPTRRVVVIDRPGAVQTEIRVGNVALPRRHPDFLALDIASKILGGEGGNRLHRVLRSERGLTYGASADLNALKDTGDVVADTDTRSETTAEALRLIVDEFSLLRRQRVQQRELNDAQEYLTGSFPLTIETPSAIALQVLNAVFYGLDLGDLQTYRERVNAVTVDDIQRVAQHYLHPDRLTIVLVGDASVFAKQLAGVGFDQVERIPLAELDLSSPDLRRHSPTGRLEPIAFQTAPAADAQALVDRAIRAKGGVDLLRSIRSIRAMSTATALEGPAAGVPIPTTTSIRYPGAFRVEMTTASGPVIQVFNGGEFWVQDKTLGPRSAPPALAAEMRESVQRDVILMLNGLADGKLSATRRPDLTEGGKSCPVLEVGTRGMRPVTMVLDPATALIVKLRYTAGAPPGGAAMEESFSDYRDVNGLKVAFRTVVASGGVPYLQRVVRSVEYNVPLESSLFTKPS